MAGFFVMEIPVPLTDSLRFLETNPRFSPPPMPIQLRYSPVPSRRRCQDQFSELKERWMGGKPRPDPSIVSGFRVAYVEGGRKYYFDAVEQRYYSWDSLHGEFEVFDRRGFHLGSVCPETGLALKPAVRGRRIKPN
ncbi:colicin E3/pyocin S6 family cytotoxin [Pseudomonas sp. 37 R 15]